MTIVVTLGDIAFAVTHRLMPHFIDRRLGGTVNPAVEAWECVAADEQRISDRSWAWRLIVPGFFFAAASFGLCAYRHFYGVPFDVVQTTVDVACGISGLFFGLLGLLGVVATRTQLLPEKAHAESLRMDLQDFLNRAQHLIEWEQKRTPLLVFFEKYGDPERMKGLAEIVLLETANDVVKFRVVKKAREHRDDELEELHTEQYFMGEEAKLLTELQIWYNRFRRLNVIPELTWQRYLQKAQQQALEATA